MNNYMSSVADPHFANAALDPSSAAPNISVANPKCDIFWPYGLVMRISKSCIREI